ncbi:MAG: hypothetical protein AAGE84_10790 [Cyanobacteria bacterium P01_G01_bin.39]
MGKASSRDYLIDTQAKMNKYLEHAIKPSRLMNAKAKAKQTKISG